MKNEFMESKFGEFARKLVFRYTNLGAPRYSYIVSPLVLATIILEIERLDELDGSIVEIGVARGMTTRFICEHLRHKTTEQRLYAIDTFSSFTKEDTAHEIEHRGKTASELDKFRYNDYGVWKKNFTEFGFLEAIQADCSKFDFSTIAPIKLAFLDVDLYLPTRNALPKVYDQLLEGGVILVDDVTPNQHYDGSYQAYMEFVEKVGQKPDIRGGRCGVVRKGVVP